MSELIQDPEKMELIALLIARYCKSQTEIMSELVHNIKSLSGSWDDEQTFGAMSECVELLEKNFNVGLEKLGKYGSKYFGDRAEEIRKRPK